MYKIPGAAERTPRFEFISFPNRGLLSAAPGIIREYLGESAGVKVEAVGVCVKLNALGIISNNDILQVCHLLGAMKFLI